MHKKKHFPAELLVMQPVWNEAPHNPQETILPERSGRSHLMQATEGLGGGVTGGLSPGESTDTSSFSVASSASSVLTTSFVPKVSNTANTSVSSASRSMGVDGVATAIASAQGCTAGFTMSCCMPRCTTSNGTSSQASLTQLRTISRDSLAKVSPF